MRKKAPSELEIAALKCERRKNANWHLQGSFYIHKDMDFINVQFGC